MYPQLKNQNQSDYLKWILLLALAALWGTSFILMKRGLEVFTPFQVAGLRIFVAFLFMVPVFFYVGRRETQWKDLPWLFLVGLVGNTIPPFLFCFAQLRISSAEAGIFNALTPLFTLIIGSIFFSYKTNRLKNAGIGLGLLGAVMLILLRYDLKMNMQLSLYPIFIILAAILYGIGANNLKTRLSHIHPITTASMLYITTGYLGGLVLLNTDFFQTLHSHPRAYRAVGYVVVLGIFCTALAMIVFNYLLRRTSVVFASTVTYLMPVVSLLWGVLDGEPMNAVHLAALGFILTGIYLTSR
jgi:drug/metabolite transporter (DMT)-like permease